MVMSNCISNVKVNMSMSGSQSEKRKDHKTNCFWDADVLVFDHKSRCCRGHFFFPSQEKRMQVAS